MDDAVCWWLSVERQYGERIPDWSDFKLEFEKKYFTPQVRDRLETQFMALEQGVEPFASMKQNL